MEMTRKLFLQRHLLKIKGKELSKHEPVLLINAQSNKAIDADCANRTFVFVTREQGEESWRTGVDWYLEPQQDGSWCIYNQGQTTHLLGGSRGTVGLFDKSSAKRLKGDSWMLYEHKESGTYALRPQGDTWLTHTDEGLSLEAFSTDIPEASLWKIERPAPQRQRQAETAQVSFLVHVRRFLGGSS